MTPAEIARLRELLAKATPGPWRWTNQWGIRYTGGPQTGEWMYKPDHEHDYCQMMGGDEGTVEVFDDGSACGEYGGIPLDSDDCKLIAALRNAAPELIEAAERLGELRYRWGEFSASNLATLHSLNAQLTAATARAEALTSRITDIADNALGLQVPGTDPIPADVHERGWQWRPTAADTAFAPPFGTIRQCRVCGCLVAGGPTACARCAEEGA